MVFSILFCSTSKKQYHTKMCFDRLARSFKKRIHGHVVPATLPIVRAVLAPVNQSCTRTCMTWVLSTTCANYKGFENHLLASYPLAASHYCLVSEPGKSTGLKQRVPGLPS